MPEALLRLFRTTGYPHTQQYVLSAALLPSRGSNESPPLAGRKLAFEWLCGSLVYLPVALSLRKQFF